MNLLYRLCVSLSMGIFLGFLIGSYKLYHPQTKGEQREQATGRIVRRIALILKYVTCLVLLLGLLWCGYFLLLGILEPSQAAYADMMSELIVSFLTVISILFAFVEFLRRDHQE